MRARGKREPVTIYELSDVERQPEHVEAFSAGLVAYRRGDFETSKQCFERCPAAAPEDGAAHRYVQRCERFLKRGVPSDWSGVTELASG